MSDTKWYTFRQNNSGGNFHHRPQDGIGLCLFIEAMDKDHALARAERIGLYFNGCSSGIDCSCCGDRWSEWCDENESPELYDEPFEAVGEGEEGFIDWGIPSYIHHIGGAFSQAKKVAK